MRILPMSWFHKLANFLEKKENQNYLSYIESCNKDPSLGDMSTWPKYKERFVKIIYDRDNNTPYMTRYYLFNTRFFQESKFIQNLPFWMQNILKWGSWNLVMHNVHQSDKDGLHNHPWPFAKLILSGGYNEYLPNNTKKPSNKDFTIHPKPAGSFNISGSNDFHKLVLNPDYKEETWSLFLMGPKVRTWGFLDKDDNFVPYDQYLKESLQET